MDIHYISGMHCVLIVIEFLIQWKEKMFGNPISTLKKENSVCLREGVYLCVCVGSVPLRHTCPQCIKYLYIVTPFWN